MNLTDRDRKILWAKSGNCCAYRYNGEICGQLLVIPVSEKQSVVAEECHIIGDKPGSARYLADFNERDTESNCILMCNVHHKIIDDHGLIYTAEILRAMKNQHEESILTTQHQAPDISHLKDFSQKLNVIDAKDVTGMEINHPMLLENVNLELNVTKADTVVGFKSNQPGIFLSTSCESCGGTLSVAALGSMRSCSKTCPHCGKVNIVELP